MIYLVYPGCSLLLWFLVFILTQGFMFVYVGEITVLWVCGWIIYNRTDWEDISINKISLLAARLTFAQAILAFILYLAFSGLYKFIGTDFVFFGQLKALIIIILIYFANNFFACFVGSKATK